MSVDIPPQFLPFVQKAIAAGRFESELAMLGEALRLLQEQEQLRQAVQTGFDQIERGECIELSEEDLDKYFEGLVHRAEERASVKERWMSRYLLSADAQCDLEEITDYIALDKPRAARELILKLKAQFRFLAANPNSGERFVGSGGLEYRRISEGNYVIYYRIIERRVLISRVVHGYRNFTP